MKTVKCMLLLVLAAGLISSCASIDHRTECMLKGAAVGAVIGGGTGRAIGNQGDVDNKPEGTYVGAGLGAIAGGIVGLAVCGEEPVDSDGDGVMDADDRCPGTPRGMQVDASGCPMDADGDGVMDPNDKCPGTPKGVKVDASGCAMDSDGDGVADNKDKCPGTPKGVKVDASGCPMDSDGDGVPDYKDKCLQTPKGARVNTVGCWVLVGVTFDTNKAVIKPGMKPILDAAIAVLNQNAGLQIEIQGHTDSIGSAAYNQKLSERRATAVMDYMQAAGISSDRLSAKGYGETKPVATNDTPAGRAENRRVQLKPSRD